MAEQNSTTPCKEALELLEFSSTASSNNPFYNEDANTTMLNVESVLYLMKDYILNEENPGIADEHSVAASMVLQCAINALELQREYRERKGRVVGGAA